MARGQRQARARSKKAATGGLKRYLNVWHGPGSGGEKGRAEEPPQAAARTCHTCSRGRAGRQAGNGQRSAQGAALRWTTPARSTACRAALRSAAPLACSQLHPPCLLCRCVCIPALPTRHSHQPVLLSPTTWLQPGLARLGRTHLTLAPNPSLPLLPLQASRGGNAAGTKHKAPFLARAGGVAGAAVDSQLGGIRGFELASTLPCHRCGQVGLPLLEAGQTMGWGQCRVRRPGGMRRRKRRDAAAAAAAARLCSRTLAAACSTLL